MPTPLGAHNPRIAQARELLTRKGRKEHGEFSFEGPTLLDEALSAGVALRRIFATPAALEAFPQIRTAESRGAELLVVDDRSMRRISDVETPSGLVAVAPLNLQSAGELLAGEGLILLMAGIGDPGNAGTLLRSAEAFGAAGVIFGTPGVEPYNPKVVRAAMGAIFRVPVAPASPADLHRGAEGRQMIGLAAEGEPLGGIEWSERSVVVVGSERQGLGEWKAFCSRIAAIPMAGPTESLNAAVAGSIALYEAAKHRHS